MKKLSLYLLLLVNSSANISCFEPPVAPSTPPKKRSASTLRVTQEDILPPAAADMPTSPAKEGLLSPEGKKSKLEKREGLAKRQLFPTGNTETERESEIEERFSKVPVLTWIDNNFNHPVLVGLPHVEATVIRSIHKLALNNMVVVAPDKIVISANNKIHRITYLGRFDEKYFLHTIDDGVEAEIKPASKSYRIEIDKNGNVLLKPA